MFNSKKISQYLDVLTFPFYVDLNNNYSKCFIAIDSNHPLFKEEFPNLKLNVSCYHDLSHKGAFINLSDKNECNFFKAAEFIELKNVKRNKIEMKKLFFSYPNRFYLFNCICYKKDKNEILNKMYMIINSFN